MTTNASIVKLIAIGIGLTAISAAALISTKSFAGAGAESLLAQDNFTVEAPNAQAKLNAALNNAADIMFSLEDKQNDANIKTSQGPRTGDLSFDSGLTIPGFDNIHMNMELSVQAYTCGGNAPGWQIELSYAGSSENITNNFSGMDVRLCNIQSQSNGSMTLTASAYLIAGANQNWFEAMAARAYISATYVPKIETAIASLLNTGH